MGNDVTIGAKITADTSEAVQSVKSFKQQLKEAQTEVIKLSNKFGETSVQAQNAAKKAAELADKIGDAKKLTDTFNPDQKFKALSNSLTGVLGGFTALTGAMGLLGVESQDVQKQLLKVQSAMAFSQGLNQLGESIASFRTLASVIRTNVVAAFSTLKGAMAATGIGLLIAAIASAIAYFSKLTSAAERAAEAQKEALEVRQKYADIGLQGEEAFIAREGELQVAQAMNAGKSEEEIFSIQQHWQNQRLRSLKRYLADVGSDNAKGVEATKRIRDLEIKMEIDRLNFLTDQKKKSSGGVGATPKENEGKDKPVLRFATPKENEGKDKPRLRFATDAENELEVRQELYRKILDNKRVFVDLGKDLDQEETDSIMANLQKQNEMDDWYSGERIRIAQAEATIKMELASQVGNAFGALSTLLGQQTAAGKAAALIEIAINTAVGFMQGLVIAQKSAKAAGPGAALAFPIFYAMQIGAVLAAASKAKAILSSGKTPSSAGSGGASVSAPSAQLPAATQTLLNQNQLNQIGNAASRAFVVESDVTNNQERTRRLNRAARL